jgi:uncharacterized protein (PEP-CTERM system associated)
MNCQIYSRLHKVITLCVFVGGGSVASHVYSADWSGVASLAVGELYTDNKDLVHANKRSEFITTITPNVSLQGVGAKANLTLNASLEANSSNDGDSVKPRLGAAADAELFEDLIFLDTSVNITQNTIDAFLPGGADSLNNSNNTTNVYNYQISPYLVHRFKGVAEIVGRYTYNYQLNSDNSIDDTNSQKFLLGVNSGADFSRLIWGGEIKYSDSSSDGTNSELLSTDVSLGYRFNRDWSVTSSLGVESNDFVSNREENDGTRWSVSAVWTPTSRTSLNIGYGDRFFGSVPTFDFTHRSRRSSLTASYSRELTDSADLLSQQSAFETTGFFGEPIDPVSSDPLSTINITRGVFVNEAFKLSYTLVGKRSSITVGSSHSIQKYEDGRADETLEKYDLSMNRSISRKLVGNAGYSLSQQSREGSADALTTEYSLGVTRKLSAKSNLVFTYRFIDRESEDLNNDYQENRLQLSFSTKL